MGPLLHAFIVSWFSRPKRFHDHFHEEQIRKQFAWTSDREEFIAKKKNLLVPDYQSRPPIDNVGNTSTLKEL